jgi:hypothetical protein
MLPELMQTGPKKKNKKNMGKTNWNGKLSKRSNEDSNSKDNIF